MVKIYALRERLIGRRQILSDAIQHALTDAIGLPPEKRAHRFFPLEKEDLYMPPDRTDNYVLIEITLMSGRTTETRKKLVRRLFERVSEEAGIANQDIEIVLMESGPENWGFRGLHGDEAQLHYRVRV